MSLLVSSGGGGGGPITASDITDAGTAGRAVLQAETPAQGRTALGVPESTGRPLADVVNIPTWGDSLTQGTSNQTPWPTQLATLTGFNTINKGVGGETAAKIATRFLADTENYTRNYVIWAGRNDVKSATTAAQTKDSIQSCVTAAGHTNYLVLGVTTGSDLSAPQIAKVAEINAALLAAFGAHFIDINAGLLNDALAYLGLTPTAQDTTDIAAGIVPTQLRVDAIHLTTAALGYVAHVVQAAFSTLLGDDLSRTLSLTESVGMPRKPVLATTVTVGSESTKLSQGSGSTYLFLSGLGLVPATTNASDLGAMSYKWRDGVFSRDVFARAIVQPAATTPASATATGVLGTIVWDADYIYVCVATNTWKRVAITTW